MLLQQTRETNYPHEIICLHPQMDCSRLNLKEGRREGDGERGRQGKGGRGAKQSRGTSEENWKKEGERFREEQPASQREREEPV